MTAQLPRLQLLRLSLSLSLLRLRVGSQDQIRATAKTRPARTAQRTPLIFYALGPLLSTFYFVTRRLLSFFDLSSLHPLSSPSRPTTSSIIAQLGPDRFDQGNKRRHAREVRIFADSTLTILATAIPEINLHDSKGSAQDGA